MELQDNEEQYKHSIWEIYRKEWATASPEKRIELNKRMNRWQELMKSGWTAQQAYYKAMEEELDYRVVEEPADKSPRYSFWAKMHKAPLIILGLALVAAIVYCVVIIGDRNALNTELESVQSELTSTKTELADAKQKLAPVQAELADTKQKLASTQADLETTRAVLDATQAELTSTRVELEAAQAEVKRYQETFGAEIFSGKQPT